MPAYPEQALTNLHISTESDRALRKRLITKQEHEDIKLAYPSMLYAPGDMVRVGLGLLTLFIILLSTGLLVLLFSAFNSIAGFSIFMGVLCYGALEMMVSKRHFNSGVDNMLMMATTCFIAVGVGAGFESTTPWLVEQVMSLLVLGICTYLSWRFVDSFMAVVAGAAFLVLVLFTCLSGGVYGSAVFPFILILASAAIFYVASLLQKRPALKFYHNTFWATRLLMMAAFYFAGNYFFVHEVVQTLVQPVGIAKPLLLSWFFWCWTFVIPLVFLFNGIQTRQREFIIAGLVLVLPAILTFRYYHAILPAEVAMFVAGIVLIPVSYLLTRYLQTPRHGFTFIDSADEKAKRMNVEGIIVGEVLSGHSVPETENECGGGSFGGAGAGDRY